MQIAIIILIKRPEDNDNETKEWVEKKVTYKKRTHKNETLQMYYQLIITLVHY